MRLDAHERMLEEQGERDRRCGLEQDADEEFARELELADRIAEQASLPPGDALGHAAARDRLGYARSPYEQPHEPEPARLAEGDRFRFHDGEGPRPGRVVRTLDQGFVEVDFGRYGRTVVAADEIEPDAN